MLIGRAELDDALQPWGRCGLAVLASGPIPPNPRELLGSAPHGRACCASCEQRFDFVIIDAPPLLPVTDAAVLSRICDGAVLVVRYGKTRREQLERTAQALRTVDARILGTVMNMAPTKGPDAYAYGYGYSYATSRAPTAPDQPVTAQGDVLPDTRVGRRAQGGALAPSSGGASRRSPSRTGSGSAQAGAADPALTAPSGAGGKPTVEYASSTAGSHRRFLCRAPLVPSRQRDLRAASGRPR